MKRWLPYALVALGLGGLLAGWLTYPLNVRDGANCQISALYREHFQGGSSCYRGFGDLYVSIALLVVSVPLALGGGVRALSRHTPRLRPQALGVLGHDVGDTARLIGGWPPSAV